MGAVFYYLAAHMAAAVITDLRSGRIPDRLVASLAVGGLALGISRGLEGLCHSLLGCFLAFALLTAISVSTGGAIGGGDIKLMAAAGLYLGPGQTLQALFWAFLAGGILSLLMLCLRLVTVRGTIPYAPAIAIGVLAAAASAVVR